MGCNGCVPRCFLERDIVVNPKLIKSIMRQKGLSGLPTREKGRRNLVNVATSEDLVNRNLTTTRPNSR
jgi:hypothetical protein